MNIIWAVIALGALAIVAAILGIVLGKKGEDPDGEVEDYIAPSGGCCGMHITCERDSLLSAVSSKIVYYDDEELDRYQGTSSSEYSSESVDEFRDVLVTLREDDVAGWVRSLQLRDIEIPEELKPEIFLVVQEVRDHHMEYGPEA